mmetsp:Transcript_5173/g.9308  ORF Transcript_5173/g.9308 Transcript_5173/m.9308 type:complete len:210 (+) Transcript_5173:368-997(+)
MDLDVVEGERENCLKEVPKLQELCIRKIVNNITSFGVLSLEVLDQYTLATVLEQAGSRVTPEVLRKVARDHLDDPDILAAIEPAWKKLCMFKYKAWIGDRDTSKTTWRELYKEMDLKQRARLRRTEERMEAKRKLEKKQAARKSTKLLEIAPRISSRDAGTRTSFRTSSSPSITSLSRGSRGKSKDDKMSKLLRLAKKNSSVTKAKIQR